MNTTRWCYKLNGKPGIFIEEYGSMQEDKSSLPTEAFALSPVMPHQNTTSVPTREEVQKPIGPKAPLVCRKVPKSNVAIRHTQKVCADYQQHPHYNCIRAFADGWQIEIPFGGKRVPISTPVFYPWQSFFIRPDAEGWLPLYTDGLYLSADTKIKPYYGTAQLYLLKENIPVPKVKKVWQWFFKFSADSSYSLTTDYYESVEELVAKHNLDHLRGKYEKFLPSEKEVPI